MNIKIIKNFIKKKIANKKENQIIYLRALIHLINYFLYSSYRKKKCIVNPSIEFFYKYKNLANYFSIPLWFVARYLKKKKIFISMNNCCNESMGHIYAEIDLLKRMQHFEKKYLSSVIWFTTSRKEILSETKDILENKNFKVLFGGIKRIILTFVGIKYPSVTIDGSISHTNFFLGKNYKNRIVYNTKPKQRIRLHEINKNYFPLSEKMKNYSIETLNLMQNLNITKKYVVIQIKTQKVNGTLKPLSPDLLLNTIEYFQNKDYQIVFAGREKFPNTFLNKSIINYANSKYASALNDFLIIRNCSLVISSASGFHNLADSLNKPVLIINGHHLIQNFGTRSIYLPTILSHRSKAFNAKIQHNYLCTYGADCGYDSCDDLCIFHMPTSEEILIGAKETEEMLSEKIPTFTTLQKKICNNGGCPLMTFGLSRISDNYLTKHRFFFED